VGDDQTGMEQVSVSRAAARMSMPPAKDHSA
jgi:hypothetical protein